MTKAILQREANRFLSSVSPEVLCIRGNWGSGKTHAWRDCLATAAQDKTIKLERYSYCSLFGVNSLADLKTAIVERTVKGASIASPPTMESFGQVYAEAESWARRGSGIFLKLPFLNKVGDAVSQALFLSVRNQIVCIDDLERKGSALSVGDVLGLISYLKEERNCKVVLILNEEELKDRAEFKEYLEKVIDTSVLFAPSPAECVEIALNKDSEIFKYLKRFCSALEITNIRVIVRVRKLAEIAMGQLQGRDGRLIEEAVRSLVVLGWTEFMPKIAPPLSLLESRTLGGAVPLSKRQELSEAEARWHQQLDQIDFGTITPLDEALLSGVKNGYFDQALLTNLAGGLEEQLKNNDRRRMFNEAWDRFHGSFLDDEEDVSTALVRSLKEAVNLTTPTSLDGVITTLKSFGRTAEAEEVIRYYMENREGDRNFFALRPGHPLDRVTDPDLRAAFRLKSESFTDERSDLDVLVAIGSASVTRADIERLKRLSPAQIREGLKVMRGHILLTAMDNLIELNNEIAENGNSIADNMRAALSEIRSESRLNAARVDLFFERTDA